MGNTVWVLKDSQVEDEWDHSLMIEYENQMNEISEELRIKKISDFYDFSILSEEFGVEEELKYVNPSETIEVLLAIKVLLEKRTDNRIERKSELIEELEDCLNKITEAKNNNSKVRLVVIP